MTEYERGYNAGEKAKKLGLRAELPDAVASPDRFNGYCDGYMLRPQAPRKPKEIVEKIISSIDFI